MITADQIQFVEREIDYLFGDKGILANALTAAHRDEHTSTNGNRRLARVGEDIMNLIVDDAWEAGNSTRAEANHDNVTLMSKDNLARIAVRSNIEKCIEASSRQQEHPLPPAVLANAIKALVCACWKDSGKKLPVARHVLERLLVHSDVVPAAFQQAVQIAGQSDSQGARPALFDDAGFTLDTEDRRSTTDDEPDFLGFSTLELNVNFPHVRDSEEWLNTADCDFDAYLINLDSPITQPHNPGNATSSNETVNPTGNTNNNPVASQAISCDSAALKRPAQSEESRSRKRQASSSGHVAVRTSNDSGREQRWFGKYVQEEIDKCKDHHPTSRGHRFFLESGEHIISTSQLGHQADTARIFYYLPISCTAILCIQDMLKSFHSDAYAQRCELSDIQTNAQRYHIIETVQKEIAYLDFLRRYQIWRLYTDNTSIQWTELNSGFVNETIQTLAQATKPTKKRIGNPVNCATADLISSILLDIFPNFDEKEETEQKRLRRRIKDWTALGRRIDILKENFGIGILALLPSTTSDRHLSITDECLMRLREEEFRELIDLMYNHVYPLKEFASAASVIVEHMFNEEHDDGRRFVLEDASAAEIMSKPSGSPQLLRYLSPITT